MRLDKIIREKGDKIKCEAEPGDGGKHAGMIVLNEDGRKEVLGKTDPIFKTAKEAVTAAQKSVDMIRKDMPIFKAAEEPKVEAPKKGEKDDTGSDDKGIGGDGSRGRSRTRPVRSRRKGG